MHISILLFKEGFCQQKGVFCYISQDASGSVDIAYSY